MSAAQGGHAEAYKKWFVRSELERKKRKIAPGRKIPGFPEQPPGPDDVHYLIFDALRPLSETLAAKITGVHRTTVSRWLSGAVQIPDAAYAMLRFHAEGVPPGCGERWRGFRFESDGLICPDGKTHVTALEIAGLQYQRDHITALQDEVKRLEQQLADMTRRVDWGSANDAFTQPGDPRALAFVR